MSGQGGEPRPPRRPKPGETQRPKTRPISDGEEPSTFKPNPNRTTKPRAPSSRTDVDPSASGPSWWERILFGSVSSGQLAMFCRQFGAYQNSGVDIAKALVNLEKHFSRTALGPVIGRLA